MRFKLSHPLCRKYSYKISEYSINIVVIHKSFESARYCVWGKKERCTIRSPSVLFGKVVETLCITAPRLIYLLNKLSCTQMWIQSDKCSESFSRKIYFWINNIFFACDNIFNDKMLPLLIFIDFHQVYILYEHITQQKHYDKSFEIVQFNWIFHIEMQKMI